MSRRSAPSATSRSACASAAAGSKNSPPSEKESGVTLSTPITSTCGLASSADNMPCRASRAVPDVEEGALMARICAVPKGESRRKRVGRCPKGQRLVADLERQFLGPLDQLADRALRGEHAHQLALSEALGNRLRQPSGVSKGKFPPRGDARGPDQLGLGLAHALEAHAVGDLSPFQDQLFAKPGRARQFLAAQ